MASQLALTIGAGTVFVSIKGTNARIIAALKRYAVQKGIETKDRTTEEIGTDVLTSLLKYMRDVSVDRHRAELRSAQDAADEGLIAGDNDL